MRNRDLVVLVSRKTGFTIMDTKELLDCLLETIIESLDKGHKVRINGFGTFGLASRAEKTMSGCPAVNGKLLKARKIPKFWFHRPIHNKLTKYGELKSER